MPRNVLTPLEQLTREPGRFSLDQAVAVLGHGRDPTELSYVTTGRLGWPVGEAAIVDQHGGALLTPTFGLVGPGGVLPRHYTAQVDGEDRRRSPALHAFLDLLGRRFTGLFVKAGAKYRPTRNARLTNSVLSAVVGLGTPHLAAALATPLEAVLFHAGGLGGRSRSTERLRGLLAAETGGEVEIVEFTGGWIRLPMSEQSQLPSADAAGRFTQLGVDATAGSQVWDASARFVIRLGPLSLKRFESLLPGAPLHTRLVELVRLEIGLEQDFALNPVLAAGEVPALALGGDAKPRRLGWDSWSTAPRPRTRDCPDAVLRAVAPDMRSVSA
ncbi:type VI secretion system baseplate subunit TssG [Alsobacter metallidurans]|nr:type VI secretion system baseplate subunit TssG [Alsobacter metallidurans]